MLRVGDKFIYQFTPLKDFLKSLSPKSPNNRNTNLDKDKTSCFYVLAHKKEWKGDLCCTAIL